MNANQIADIYPLSPMQHGMLFHSLYAPETGNYHEQSAWKIEGTLDIDLFTQAWRAVINRHTALRTAFVWEELDEPLQVVYRQLDAPLTELDWRGVPAAEQAAHLEQFLAADRAEGFDLTAAPLMRLAVMRLDANSYYFVWSHHHLLLDGWSQQIIFKDLFTWYESLRQGMEPPLPPARPYREYIAWLQGQDRAAAEAFWQAELAGFAAPTPLTIERQHTAVEGDFIFTKARLSEEVTTALQTLARRQQITLNTILQGAWALLLSRYSGEDDVLFGATTAGRPPDLPDVESMVGLFINTLPARVHIDETQPAADWLTDLHQKQTAARAYDYLPLTDLQQWSDVPADVPLFESLFIFESYPIDETVRQVSQAGSLKIAEAASFTRTNFPLLLAVSPGSEVGLMVGCDNGRFDEDAIERLMGHLQTLLTSIARNPQAPLGELPLLTPAEAEQLLVTWNETAVTPLPDTCIHELFEMQVKRTPEATAVFYEDQTLTYAELNQRANQLARHLQKLGVGPESIVGVYMERSLELMVSILGILKAGGVYLPLDTANPPGRITYLLADARPQVILTQSGMQNEHGAVPEITLPADVEITVLNLDDAWEEIAQEADDNLPLNVTPDNLAYIIYTSGSTGQPKGVMLPHRGLCNLAQAYVERLELQPGRRLLQFFSLGFDGSLGDLFPPLIAGAALYLAPRTTLLSLPDLHRYLQEQAITHISMTPSMLSVLPNHDLPDLRVVLAGGEQATVEMVSRWLPGRRFVNAYGPTEATVVSVWYSCEDLAELPDTAVAIPIGRPMPHTQLYILDKQNRPVPVGVPGELVIGGVGVARGYLNRPDLTTERFVRLSVIGNQLSVNSDQLPATDYGPPNIVYRTGDLCRYLPDGNIEFLGRIDHQVKVRGFRIELGEIETVLWQHEAVETAVAITAENEQGEKHLIAYLVPTEESEIDFDELRQYLKNYLPLYMIPDQFILLDELPRLPNGKVNRRALPAPDADLLASRYVPPRNPTEEILAGLWAQVLGVERVGVHDSFFALGGHSLKATQLVSRIREAFGRDLPLRRLFEKPTIADTAVFLQTEQADGRPPIQPAPRDAAPPLSFAQQRLWFLEQLAPGNIAYNIPLAVRLNGELDVTALQQSLQEITRRHEALRTVFVEENGRPAQRILPDLTIPLPVTDLRHLPAAERETKARELAVTEAKRPFDLAAGPLIRAALLQLADDEYVALLTMHHIISDGWSMGVFIQEMAALYAAFTEERPSPLPDLPIQYADFAHWQREWLQGETLESQLDYWQEQLAGAAPFLDLPTDQPRPAVQSANGATETFILPPEMAQQLAGISQAHGATLFMTLLAAFQTLLYRYSGQTSISVGTPIANRTQAEIEGLIGFFVNTLVMHTDLSGQPDFEELLARVRETALGAYAHQDLPFEMLVERLQPNRDLSHTPLFQVMFVLDNAPLGALELPNLTLSPVEADGGTATFDMTLTLRESPGGLLGMWEYNTDLFDRSTIQRMIGHFQTLLQGIVTDPQRPITELPLLTPAEQQLMLVEWNDTAVPFPDNTCIHHLFEEQAERQPGVTAVTLDDQSLTYDQLNRKANQLAHYLIAQGVAPEAIVGIHTRRSLEMVVGILAALKAGAAYLPLDPTYPPERLAFMIADAQPAVILTQFEGEAAPFSESNSLSVIHLDDDWGTIARQPESNPAVNVTADNLAYVIYTSGSTGKPKGAMLQHRGLCNLTDVQRRAFDIRAGESRILQFSPLSFDASVWETFMALRNGATLVLAHQETLTSGLDLLRLLQEERVTTVTLPPSLLAVLPETELPHLETIIAAGEACSPELVARWGPGRAFFNAYGPTETTVCASMFRADPADPNPPPIGKPIANFQLYVLDAQQQPVPIGVPGELCVAGVGLARGYLNRPELTAEKFSVFSFQCSVDRPLNTENSPLNTVYRTGDLVRYRPDGNLEFLGRIDHQVKVRGFRIELGEIEAALEQHPAVQMTAVLAREDSPGDKRLVAYVVPETMPGPAEGELRRFLRQTLPAYMIPAQFVALAEMPLTPSNKIDRQALPAPNRVRPDQAASFVPPRNETEEQLAAICAELLQVEKVGVFDNFFELGGHSLLATQFISRVRDGFGVEIPLRTLFETPTVADLALALAVTQKSGPQPQAPAITRVSRERRRMKRAAVTGGNGSAPANGRVKQSVKSDA